jgi:hypothetical protein
MAGGDDLFTAKIADTDLTRVETSGLNADTPGPRITASCPKIFAQNGPGTRSKVRYTPSASNLISVPLIGEVEFPVRSGTRCPQTMISESGPIPTAYHSINSSIRAFTRRRLLGIAKLCPNLIEVNGEHSA